MPKLQIVHSGVDDWSRPLYKDAEGKVYVDLDGELYSANSFGEPSHPYKGEVELVQSFVKQN